jgi:purine nucleosidase
MADEMERLSAILAAIALLQPVYAQKQLVLIDQDGAGPGDSNQMSMMVLLQSPRAEVLGITIVTGSAWRDEEVQHTLRMLELVGRTDVPVVPGAVFPLVRTREETVLAAQLYGKPAWWGAWDKDSSPPAIPPLKEGAPKIKPAEEDAAHFLIRQVRAHPRQVTVYAAGPLTNIALAISLDPQFAELTKGIVIMGGSLNPQTNDPDIAANPRHEFNFWFDPEAAHIVLRAHWPRIDVTTVDPAIITTDQQVYMDVDVSHGPGYGDTLTWPEKLKPVGSSQLVHAQMDVDLPKFTKMFVDLMSSPK